MIKFLQLKRMTKGKKKGKHYIYIYINFFNKFLYKRKLSIKVIIKRGYNPRARVGEVDACRLLTQKILYFIKIKN